MEEAALSEVLVHVQQAVLVYLEDDGTQIFLKYW
jgi:hypothetical protein